MCVALRVCGTYVVHHLNGTELCCAQLTCIMHHRTALWIMMHKGDLFFFKGRDHPQCFRWRTRNIQKTDTICPYMVGHKEIQQTLCSAVFLAACACVWVCESYTGHHSTGTPWGTTDSTQCCNVTEWCQLNEMTMRCMTREVH